MSRRARLLQTELARRRIAQAALVRLQELLDARPAPAEVRDRLRSGLQRRLDGARSQLDPVDGGAGGAEVAGEVSGESAPAASASYAELRRLLLQAETAELSQLRADGEIGEEVRRTLQRRLDLEAAGLEH